MDLTVQRLEETRREDFYRVHCDAFDTGWCNCVAWWVPSWEGWGERDAESNRALRDDLFDAGHYDGFLLYVGEEPAAWCQCGPRDRLAKLRDAYGLEPDPDVWALSCFLTAPRFRGRGLMHGFLAGILEQLDAQGVRHVQGFPKRGQGLDAGEVWTGPEALFRKAGFALERDHPRLPVYGKRLGEEVQS